MRLLPVVLALVFVGSALAFSASIAPNQAAPNPPQSTFLASPPSDSVWWVGAQASDSSALPNTGVQTSIQVMTDSSLAANDCLSFWIADALTNNYWGQVGYYLCDGDLPVAFYQVWNLNTNTILVGGTQSVSAGVHTFSMYLQSGTTWAYALDGTVFGTYDMSASVSSSSYPVDAFSEEQAVSVFSFPTVTLSSIQVMNSGVWVSVHSAKSYGASW